MADKRGRNLRCFGSSAGRLVRHSSLEDSNLIHEGANLSRVRLSFQASEQARKRFLGLLHLLFLVGLTLVFHELASLEPDHKETTNDLQQLRPGHIINQLLVQICCELIVIQVVSNDVIHTFIGKFVLQ